MQYQIETRLANEVTVGRNHSVPMFERHLIRLSSNIRRSLPQSFPYDIILAEDESDRIASSRFDFLSECIAIAERGMSMSTKSVDEFLARHRQDAGSIDAMRWTKTLLADMKAGLENRPSGLEMNPSYLSPDIRVRPYRKVLAMDAGGTHFRYALATTDENAKITLGKIHSIPMPGSAAMLSKIAFYDAIAVSVEEFAKAADSIGFCFSYSVAMTPDIDGTLTDWAKEIDAPEVIGSRVGACTKEALRNRGVNPGRIILLNDTVSTLLAGMDALPPDHFAGGVGFVYGTGINVGYAERCENIMKRTAPGFGGRMVINTECGNYNGLLQGSFDRIVDDASLQPGTAKTEKMTSGRYLSDVIVTALKQAMLEGLILTGTDRIDGRTCGLAAISAFIADPNREDNPLHAAFSSPADRDTAASIAIALIDRAAKIGAIMTAAAILKTAADAKDPRPYAIFAEGTTFHRLSGYRTAYAKHLQTVLADDDITFEIITGPDWPLIGAAIAALS